MSEKKMPPPPSLPPRVERRDNFCLFHKGELHGDLYTCPTCKAQYCMECARTAKAEGRHCIKCKQIIIL